MRIDKFGKHFRIKTEKYALIFDRERMLAMLTLKESGLYYYMSLLSATDQLGRSDNTIKIKGIRLIKKEKGSCLVEIQQKSSLWLEKRCYYKCFEDTFEYYVVVKGNGRLDRIYFFRGRTGPNELGSIPGFNYLFTACPNFLEKDYFHASEYASINSGHESFAWGFALSSGPLCFAFTNDFKSPWFSIGVLAKEGEYGFQSFEFNHKPESVKNTHDSIVGTQSFSLAYFGHLKVSGIWETPHLVFNMARDKYASIRKYVGGLYKNGYLKRQRSRTYRWWRKPIFCGWHEQVAESSFGFKGNDVSRQFLEAGPVSLEACTQKNYEKWLTKMMRNDVNPGIIIIDGNWQVGDDMNEVDTRKWPDIRGFIDRCHHQGQKVLLWINVWKKDRVPDDECLLLNGKPFCIDPTNPKYIQRMKHEIWRMLSGEPGCYNADGFKIDGTSVQPFGYTMKTYRNIYGFELQKVYLKMVYHEAKRIKKDALISLFIANPYFRNVCDMVRTGDMYTVKGHPQDAMVTRAKIIKIGMPGAIIDTDGELRFSMKPDYIDIIEKQAKVGVPTIYNAERITRMRTFALPVFERFSPKDYRRISRTWRTYLEKWGKTVIIP